MWEDAKGNWNAAHAIAQDIETRPARGSTLTCTERKGISGMPAIGTGGPGSRLAHDTLEEEWARICQRLLCR